MSEKNSPGHRGLIIVAAAWLVLALIAIAVAYQNTSTPGLYYDEAVFAGLTKDFVTNHARLHMPGCEVIRLFGRPFPMFVQYYLGALKSWMEIPAQALFGSSVAVVRLTTLFWSLIALLLFMLGTKRWLGSIASIVAGTGLMFDPAYFFLSTLDWGAAISSMVCRCAAFFLILLYRDRRNLSDLFFAAFFIGLAVFNKFDFVAFIAGAGISTIIFYGPQIWRDTQRPARIMITAAIGGSLGFGAMVFNLPKIVTDVLSGKTGAGPGELSEKLHTLVAMYDGSYFYRLMKTGGPFEKMYEQPARIHSLFGLFLLIAVLALLVIAFRGKDDEQMRRARFLLTAFALITLFVFLIPGAVRIHHSLLVFPVPQLIIATAFSYWWTRKSSRERQNVTRALLLGLMLVFFGSQLFAIFKTEKLLRETGGRGRWSDAFDHFCRENDRSDLRVISLDWGFNEQLAFLTEKPELVEPFWAFKETLPPLPERPQNLYLAHSREYSLFRNDVAYLEALQLGDQNVEIKPYADREGRIVFYTIRFPVP